MLTIAVLSLVFGVAQDSVIAIVGRRADLILVEGNPLEDLARLRHPVAVMARGTWLDSGRLERLVASLGGSNGSEQR